MADIISVDPESLRTGREAITGAAATLRGAWAGPGSPHLALLRWPGSDPLQDHVPVDVLDHDENWGWLRHNEYFALIPTPRD